MTCCPIYQDAADRQFTDKIADRDLATYHRKGAGLTTRLLCDALVAAGVTNGSLLDIGTGIGSLTFELLDRGISKAIAVDASMAYIRAASEEAARRNRSGVIQFVIGDFLTVAGDIPSATVVALDRVICCYPRWQTLLSEALRHTDRHFAFSYPRDVWYVRAGNLFVNFGRRLRGQQFRTFVHQPAQMAELIRCAGFAPATSRQTRLWCVESYSRASTARRDDLHALEQRRARTE
jgi:magnesium-protoporphyrin O-methyltransferase